MSSGDHDRLMMIPSSVWLFLHGTIHPHWYFTHVPNTDTSALLLSRDVVNAAPPGCPCLYLHPLLESDCWPSLCCLACTPIISELYLLSIASAALAAMMYMYSVIPLNDILHTILSFQKLHLTVDTTLLDITLQDTPSQARKSQQLLHQGWKPQHECYLAPGQSQVKNEIMLRNRTNTKI